MNERAVRVAEFHIYCAIVMSTRSNAELSALVEHSLYECWILLLVIVQCSCGVSRTERSREPEMTAIRIHQSL